MELAVIIHDGMQRMFAQQENVFYYIAVMNEAYAQPAMPDGVAEGIVKGMYLLRDHNNAKVQLLGSGTILREVLGAAELLDKDFGIPSDVWSVTSFNELRRNALETERWNQLHPQSAAQKSYLEQCLARPPATNTFP